MRWRKDCSWATWRPFENVVFWLRFQMTWVRRGGHPSFQHIHHAQAQCFERMLFGSKCFRQLTDLNVADEGMVLGVKFCPRSFRIVCSRGYYGSRSPSFMSYSGIHLFHWDRGSFTSWRAKGWFGAKDSCQLAKQNKAVGQGK